MLTALLMLVCLVTGLMLGFWSREALNYLKRIQKAITTLKIAQDKQELKAKKMSMADPAEFNWDAMDDQEKINFLNS